MIRNRLLVIMALALLSGCSRESASTCASGKSCLRVGNSSDPTSLDPPKTDIVADDNVLGDLMVGLTTLDAHARPIPGIAESWTTSPDGLTWTFKLRDAVWSDGVPVTAEDFVFSLRRLQDPATASQYAYLAYVIKGAEAVNRRHAPLDTLGVKALDTHTVQFTLVHPTPYFPVLLTHFVLAPVPEHAVRRWGAGWAAPGRYVSDGPYALADWKLGDRIRLVKNPRFFDAQHVCFDEVDYYPTTDVISAERRVIRGELEANGKFLSNRIGLLRGSATTAPFVRVHPFLDAVYVAFNTHVPALNDARVRQALSMAIDRDFITHGLLRSGEASAYGVVPPGVDNYPLGVKAEWAGWPLARRQAEARRLLTLAGFGPGRPLHLKLSYTNATLQAEPLDLQADWRAVGVDIGLQSADTQIFFADLNDRDFEIALADWVADYDDPMTFLNLYRSDTGAQNYGDYASPAYDTLLDRADAEADIGRRAKLLRLAEQRLLQDAALAPVYTDVSHNLVNPRLTGWIDNLTDQHRKRWVCTAGH